MTKDVAGTGLVVSRSRINSPPVSSVIYITRSLDLHIFKGIMSNSGTTQRYARPRGLTLSCVIYKPASKFPPATVVLPDTVT
jgi:hypothetical protein